eukprot:CAMPEP_0206146210 /NCGR_PEP_ID=MMETSP1473-20131121/29707_1 /ASSEMBLY_ACC=CAM_ASM_001109 /TAXON_ID=1461547 /ORGANISM="Stichococcus sp, Strain RCC1054" /LENGTH=109 /DNA_ID=CAMNT_0053542683 /DNA_START=239 /DNA_END=568 /DNA_ORIENTATION=-
MAGLLWGQLELIIIWQLPLWSCPSRRGRMAGRIRLVGAVRPSVHQRSHHQHHPRELRRRGAHDGPDGGAPHVRSRVRTHAYPDRGGTQACAAPQQIGCNNAAQSPGSIV